MATRASSPADASETIEREPSWRLRAKGRTTRSIDGITIFYEVLDADHGDAPTLVLANGLGGRLYSWEPVVEWFSGRYRILTWDYRGLFRSTNCERRYDLAIWKHAYDARAVLDAEGAKSAVVVGWSMGVQVGLEMAAAFPERVDALVLLNGTHGHTFETAFQPFFRTPWLARYLHSVVDLLCRHPGLLDSMRRLVLSRLDSLVLGKLYGKLRRNDWIADLYRQYMHDVFGPSFGNYLRLFQELDAHSTYQHLPEIGKPALIISGGLDVLTPAYQSFEIARRMPRARHLHIPLATHFVLLEYADLVTTTIASFLAEVFAARRPA